jgi:hypothetical protein
MSLSSLMDFLIHLTSLCSLPIQSLLCITMHFHLFWRGRSISFLIIFFYFWCSYYLYFCYCYT